MELTLTKTREEWYIDYMDYREFNGRKKPANDSVRFFLNWCKRQYPDNDYLTQEMIDKRAMSFPAQNERSFASRANAINSFLKYINDRKDGPYVLIEYDHQLPPTEEPVLFTREELLNFFQATDEIEYKEGCKIPYPRFQSKLKAIIVPVIFRLMYSTGIRSGEARHLKCQDVDLDRGVLYLRDVKGYNQRLVALHPSMTEMLRHYDTLMANEMPNREAFFPNAKDEPRDAYFISTQFKKCWYKYNKHGEREVIPYSLRHNYVVENIMSWEGDDDDVIKQKMIVLSKSLGHKRITDTMYYFHLVPRFADLLEKMALSPDSEGDIEDDEI